LSESVADELKQRILKYMGTVSKAKNRDRVLLLLPLKVALGRRLSVSDYVLLSSGAALWCSHSKKALTILTLHGLPPQPAEAVAI
jgi:hypothetical protein